MLINIIGAGRLGKTIARLIHEHKAGVIQAVMNANFYNAEQAVHFISEGNAVESYEDLPPADITFITSPDDCIIPIFHKLLEKNCLKDGSILVHCSGCLSSYEFINSSSTRIYGASVHPIRSFANPETSVEEFKGTFCAIEGHTQAVACLNELFEKIGGITFSVDPQKKAVYHAAGVFSSNYFVTLYAKAVECLCEAGIEEYYANDIILNLMEGTLKNLKALRDPKKALTGPIKRGDSKTLKKHMNALQGSSRQSLYENLGLATIELTDHSEVEKESLRQSLEPGLEEKYTFELRPKL